MDKITKKQLVPLKYLITMTRNAYKNYVAHKEIFFLTDNASNFEKYINFVVITFVYPILFQEI